MPPSPTLPPWTASAPGRVNLIGEHVDYNQGWVLPMAIAQRVSITATPCESDQVHFTSSLSSEPLALTLSQPGLQAGPSWGRYVQGVLWEFMELTGATLPGFQASIESDVPQGAGLSSSAALEVATATLLEKITGHFLNPLDKARLCQRVEHQYAGVPCGLMDQAASTLCEAAHVLLLDCVSDAYRQVPFSNPELRLLITNTGVSHALADSAYGVRRAQAEEALALMGKDSYRDVTALDFAPESSPLPDVLRRRVRHVVGENARTLATVAALERGDWEAVGAHLYGSHASLRDDYEVSCPELDCLVEAAAELGLAQGVYGARMTGGGFGGCTITLIQSSAQEQVQTHLAERYQRRFGATPAFYTARASAGAR